MTVLETSSNLKALRLANQVRSEYNMYVELHQNLIISILVTMIVIEIVLVTKTWRRKRPEPWSFVEAVKLTSDGGFYFREQVYKVKILHQVVSLPLILAVPQNIVNYFQSGNCCILDPSQGHT